MASSANGALLYQPGAKPWVQIEPPPSSANGALLYQPRANRGPQGALLAPWVDALGTDRATALKRQRRAPIPAQGEALGSDRERAQGLKARPIRIHGLHLRTVSFKLTHYRKCSKLAIEQSDFYNPHHRLSRSDKHFTCSTEGFSAEARRLLGCMMWCVGVYGISN